MARSRPETPSNQVAQAGRSRLRLVYPDRARRARILSAPPAGEGRRIRPAAAPIERPRARQRSGPAPRSPAPDSATQWPGTESGGATQRPRVEQRNGPKLGSATAPSHRRRREQRLDLLRPPREFCMAPPLRTPGVIRAKAFAAKPGPSQSVALPREPMGINPLLHRCTCRRSRRLL